jgi:hypothetical protein
MEENSMVEEEMVIEREHGKAGPGGAWRGKAGHGEARHG